MRCSEIQGNDSYKQYFERSDCMRNTWYHITAERKAGISITHDGPDAQEHLLPMRLPLASLP
jgi:hypothetical protein